MWVEVERPGHFGKRRAEIIARLDAQYGKGNWAEMFVVGGEILSREKAVELYEDAYVFFFQSRPGVLEALCELASEVYDNSKSNVRSGTDYSKQETPAVHLQDIAVRRAVARLGKRFNGQELVQIRSNSKNAVGQMLSPGNVPFHRPELIREPQLGGWWHPGSIEAAYQSWKIIALERGEGQATSNDRN